MCLQCVNNALYKPLTAEVEVLFLLLLFAIPIRDVKESVRLCCMRCQIWYILILLPSSVAYEMDSKSEERIPVDILYDLIR